MATREDEAIFAWRDRRARGPYDRTKWRQKTLDRGASALRDWAYADALGTGPGSIASYTSPDRAAEIRRLADTAIPIPLPDVAGMSENPQIAAAPDELARLEREAVNSEGPASSAAAPGPAPGPAPNPLPATPIVLFQLLAPLALVAAPNWGLRQEEIRALAEAWGRAIDKYFPDAMSHMGEIVVAGIVSISVIGPRVFQRVPLRLPKERVTGVAPDGRPIRANGAETEGEKSAPSGASTAPSGTADVATGISAVS